MAVLKNRAKMSTSTTGTGSPITLGSAEDGYQTFADAGVANADVVRYVIEDGNNWEIGTGTYTATGTTLSRTVSESSNSDVAINLSGSATVFIGATAEDIPALYADNPSSATTPVASGANAVAIGDGATASGSDSYAIGNGVTASAARSIAIGEGTNNASQSVLIGFSTGNTVSGSQAVGIGRFVTASGTGSLAIGGSVAATSNYASAIGRNSSNGGSQAVTGAGAMALGGSYASGTDSFAAAIGNNTSSYGATGANSIALGDRSKSTGSRGIAIGGYGALASGASSLALGYQATANQSYASGFGYASKAYGAYSFAGTESHASGSKSVALGLGDTSTSYGALHDNGVALGYQATTSAAKQIALGSSTAQVKVSGAYTLPTADGTANQVLQTDGSGALSFATVSGGGGGADLYVANESSPAAQPTAAGANAIGIGDTAQAAGADGVAIGLQSYARAQSALGLFGDAQNVESVSIGKNSAATADGAVQLGRNGYSTATDAVSLGKSRASGASSFAAAISNNGSTYGATGSQSMSIGQFTRATSSGAAAFGGAFANASGSQSLAIGRNVLAQQQASVALGQQSLSAVAGKFAYSSTNFSATGDSQHGMCVLRQSTTDAAPKVMLTDNPAATVSAINQVILPNNSAYSFSGTIIARESATNGSDYASWEIKGALLRDANAASTVLGNGIQNKLYATSGASAWAIALTADTTNGGLKIEVTGAASTNIRWVATVNTSEVTYA